MKHVAYHPIARSEMIEAARYLEERRPGIGEKFLSAIRQVETLLGRHPKIGTPYEAGTRKFPMRQFPFALIYKETVDENPHLRRCPCQPRAWVLAQSIE